MTQIQSDAERFAAVKTTLQQASPNITQALADRLGPKGTALFVRTMLNTLQANPYLLTCTPRSLVAAALESAALGLQIDGVLGHAYVVPFWSSKERSNEAKLIPGYKGYLALAVSAGCSLWAHVVHENDEFDVDLGANKLHHRPAPGPRGDPMGAYACAKLPNGHTVFEWCPLLEIERTKDRALSKMKEGARKRSAWSTDEMAMWRKTPVRRLFKFLPVPALAQRAAEQEEQVDMAPREAEYEVQDPDPVASGEVDDILSTLQSDPGADAPSEPREGPEARETAGDPPETGDPAQAADALWGSEP
ncbi:MAG: hypothetical protein GY719_31630 [bacterium]|nr:hypothetical protein [bacterium]